MALTLVASAVAGFAALLKGWRFDPARARRRCPACWYPLEGPLPRECPECGRRSTLEKQLARTRRSRPLLALGAALVLIPAAFLASLWLRAPAVIRHVPTGPLIASCDYLAILPDRLAAPLKAELLRRPLSQTEYVRLARAAIQLNRDSPTPNDWALDVLANAAIDSTGHVQWVTLLDWVPALRGNLSAGTLPAITWLGRDKDEALKAILARHDWTGSEPQGFVALAARAGSLAPETSRAVVEFGLRKSLNDLVMEEQLESLGEAALPALKEAADADSERTSFIAISVVGRLAADSRQAARILIDTVMRAPTRDRQLQALSLMMAVYRDSDVAAAKLVTVAMEAGGQYIDALSMAAVSGGSAASLRLYAGLRDPPDRGFLEKSHLQAEQRRAIAETCVLFLRDSRPLVRSAALSALESQLGLPEAKRSLDTNTFLALLDKLAEDISFSPGLQLPVAQSALAIALRHDQPVIRRRACDVLGMCGDATAPERRAALHRLATDDTDEWVRRAAWTALSRIETKRSDSPLTKP